MSINHLILPCYEINPGKLPPLVSRIFCETVSNI